MKKLPVIDIFAGPGGLGEGFAQAGFDIRLSIEMDKTASETLKIRKFFYQFKKGMAPEEYYKFLQCKIDKEELKKAFPKEWEMAEECVFNAELGKEDQTIINQRIKESLKYDKDFILLGGPPCQAYSLAGRSRMLGLGKQENIPEEESREEAEKRIKKLEKKRSEAFYKDERHTLYREYIKLLVTFRPKIFIMENVKGILSAKNKNSNNVFEEIATGLRNPNSFLEKNEKPEIEDKNLSYRLFSVSSRLTEDLLESNKIYSEIKNPRECIIRCEDYGIPQNRHRIIIVGIRNDVESLPGKLIEREKVSVRDVIEHLPEVRSGISKSDFDDNYFNWSSTIENEYKRILKGRVNSNLELDSLVNIISKRNDTLDRGDEYVKNRKGRPAKGKLESWLGDKRIRGWVHHMTRTHIASDLARYLFCSAYGMANRRSPRIEDWEGDRKELRPKHANIILDTQNNLKSNTHKDRFKVQIWDEPSSTIVSHISKDGHYYIHPDPTQCRSLTVREAARLQTFPDNYFFHGGRTNQYHQVGNAVPPLIAFQIAEIVSDLLERENDH